MALCEIITQPNGLKICPVCLVPALAPGRLYRRCTANGKLADTIDRLADVETECVYLGEPRGEKSVECCGGRTRLIPLFHCEHPAHDLVTFEDCLVCPDRKSMATRRLLLRFAQGLGDHLQLTVVLQHLRAAHPNWLIDLACVGLWGTGFVEAGLCHAVHERAVADDDAYDLVTSLAFNDPRASYAGWPATKAETCLLDDFGIRPQPELCGYKIGIRESDREHVRRWLADRPFALLHYRGRSHQEAKNLTDADVLPAVRLLRACGLAVLVHDFDYYCGFAHLPGVELLRQRSRLWRTVPDAASLAAIAEQAALCIGIDSGPGKIFAASGTPTVTVWHGFHPLHYHALAPKVLHLVPEDHERLILPPRSVGAAYFAANYRHEVYRHDLGPALARAVHAQLPPIFRTRVPIPAPSSASAVGYEPSLPPLSELLAAGGLKEGASQLFVCSHHGDYGDCIYSLMALKRLCEQNQCRCVYYLCPARDTRALMSEQHAEGLVHLLRAQPYIERAEWRGTAAGMRIDAGQRLFRQAGLNMADQYTHYLRQPPSAEHGAWLTVPTTNAMAEVVFSRSMRYRNPRFPWPAIYRRYRDRAVFVGTPEEHADFQTYIGVVPIAVTPTLLDVARVIAGCKLFAGNQSAPRAIAEGLKVPVCVEECPGNADTHFARADAWYDIPPPEHFL